MKLDKLEIQGFKSFKEVQTFQFPTKAGLYYIGGKNLVDVELESNGSGKSSFLDAICWVFYGKTSVGLRASDAASWDRDYLCRGVVTFHKDSTIWNIARTWSPNSLKVWKEEDSPEIWEQTDVDDLIGLNYESYLRSAMFSQFGDHFFDLKPARKTEILVPILNLDIWERCSQIAGTNRTQVQGSLHDTRINASELHGYLEGLSNRDYLEDIKSWKEAYGIKELELKTVLKIKLKEIKELKELVTNALVEQVELKALKTSYTEQRTIILTQRAEVFKKRESSLSLKFQVLSGVASVKKDLERLEVLSDESICTRCGQPIDETHIEEESLPLFSDLEDKEMQLSRITKDLEFFDDRLLSIDRDLEEFELQGMDMLDMDKENATVLAQLKTRTLGVNTEIGKAKRDLATVQDTINPYVQKQEDLEQQILQTKTQVETYGKEIVGLEEAESRLSYWVSGFKKLRLFVMQEILAQFSMEVNNSLQVLGLSGWEILLQLDKENKSGTIKNEFTVFVKGPENKNFVNWESWSGGERQRLRFAGDLGLANLIKSSKGVQIDFEFYDEPTTYLGGSGIKGELEILKERALAGGKVIFIIDHKNMEDFEFTGSFLVTKDSGGSYFG